METIVWIVGVISLSSVFLGLMVLVHKRSGKKAVEAFLNGLMADAFKDRVERFEMLSEPPKNVDLLLIGDSLIQEYPHDEMFKEVTVLNRGIGGDTTDGVLQRLDPSLGHHSPRTIVLLIGTNDLGLGKKSVNAITENIAAIANALINKQPKATIHVMSLLPVNETVDAFTVGVRTNDALDAINARLKTLKTRYKFHDVNRFFKDEHNRLKTTLTRDGLHINVEGYRLLTDYIEKNILDA